MLGVRMNSFNENGLGEPEQDANSALTELDKGMKIKHGNRHRFEVMVLNHSVFPHII